MVPNAYEVKFTDVVLPKRGRDQKGKTFKATVIGTVADPDSETGLHSQSAIDVSEFMGKSPEPLIDAVQKAGFDLAHVLAEGFNSVSIASCSSQLAQTRLALMKAGVTDKARIDVLATSCLMLVKGNAVSDIEAAIKLVAGMAIGKSE